MEWPGAWPGRVRGLGRVGLGGCSAWAGAGQAAIGLMVGYTGQDAVVTAPLLIVTVSTRWASSPHTWYSPGARPG
jgi:hypothetical protein